MCDPGIQWNEEYNFIENGLVSKGILKNTELWRKWSQSSTYRESTKPEKPWEVVKALGRPVTWWPEHRFRAGIGEDKLPTWP
jgi:hypothetical protein